MKNSQVKGIKTVVKPQPKKIIADDSQKKDPLKENMQIKDTSKLNEPSKTKKKSIINSQPINNSPLKSLKHSQNSDDSTQKQLPPLKKINFPQKK